MVKRANTGIPILRSALVKISKSCEEVFSRQATSWLVFGVLSDPFHEFFIIETTPNEDSDAPVSTSAPTTLLPSRTLMNRSGKGLKSENRREFQLDVNLKPEMISPRLGEKILAVGRTVIDLRLSLEGPLSASSQQAFSDLLWKSHQSDELFNVITFEATVDEIRLPTAARLTKLLVEDSHLLSHLEALRGYMLVGNGAFYASFLEETNNLQWGVFVHLGGVGETALVFFLFFSIERN